MIQVSKDHFFNNELIIEISAKLPALKPSVKNWKPRLVLQWFYELDLLELWQCDCNPAHLFTTTTTTVIPMFKRFMSLWFIHVTSFTRRPVKDGNTTLSFFKVACCHISASPPWTINYRNPLLPALGARIWFLTKCLLRDYVGFDMSSDTEVLMLLKDFLTIPPMISYTVDVYLLFVLFVLCWWKHEAQSVYCL